MHVSTIMEPPTPEPSGKTVNCGVCHQAVLSTGWFDHVQDEAHTRHAPSYTAFLWDSKQDKCGVHVEEETLDLDYVLLDRTEGPPSVTGTFHISLTFPQCVDLIEVCIGSNLRASGADRCPSCFTPLFSDPIRLEVGKIYTVEIQFTPQGVSKTYKDSVIFIFEDTVTQQRFVIARPVQVIVNTQNETEAEMTQDIPENDVVDGIMPACMDSIQWVQSLPDAPIPKYIRDALEDGTTQEIVDLIRTDILPDNLTNESYARHWKTVLWIEEHQKTLDLQQYQMTSKPLGTPPRGINLYSLNVPGLAEQMPKVEIGDKIKVLRCNAESPWFAGYIHTLEREQVFLRFHHTFVGIRGQLFNIRLELNRLGLRQMHMALETSFYPSRILFPNSNHLTGPSSRNRTQMGDLNVVNKVIEDNRSQLMVVTAILSQPAGSVPFVILGPPGTGKTTTIIEAIKQLLIKDRSTRVLACAPSDGVADLVCQRLMALGRTQIFRLNAPTRPKTTLPPVLKDFCSLNETIFTIPPLEVLKNYRVIVSTCMTAAIPSRVGLPRGHFSHVFVDEAGQASEPEVMIPIKLLGGSESNIIISGDPKNLGPVVSSPVAQRLGLGTSYLERLINLPIYDDRTHHGVTMIKLTDNFRSHPAILKFPNENFYRTELTPCALSTVAESLLRWRGLPRQGFPIVFHAINGKDERQASSASFFNSDEASLVKKYIRDLRSDGRLRLNDSSIGVISSQGSQCMKIRSILRRENPSIKVGIPEEIQGLERRVIIISTVRSSLDFVSYDICHNLGFLAQPRRFNVALTSCQALLIIIGSPNILRLDPLWRSFLNYIHQRGGWKGLPISWDANEDQEIEGLEEAYRKEGMTELEARLKSMVLSALDEEEGGARPGNTDPETQTIFQDGV